MPRGSCCGRRLGKCACRTPAGSRPTGTSRSPARAAASLFPPGGAPSARSARRFPHSGAPRTAGRAGCGRRRAGPARASPRGRPAPRQARYRTGAGSRGSRTRQPTAPPATRRFPPAARPSRTATPTARPPRTSTRSTGASPATRSRSRTGSTYANALLTRTIPSMLTGKGATPAFSSRSLKSSTAGIPLRRDRVPAGALERGQLTGTDAPHPQRRPRRGEQRLKVPRRPAGIARGSPAVVIEAAPEHDRARIMRGAAADHARAAEPDHPAGELARVAPVVGRRDSCRVEQVARPPAAAGWPVVRPGLQQQRALSAALGERPATAAPAVPPPATMVSAAAGKRAVMLMEPPPPPLPVPDCYWGRVQATSRRRPSSAASRSMRSRLRSVHRPEARSSRRRCTARCPACGPTLVHTDIARRTCSSR